MFFAIGQIFSISVDLIRKDPSRVMSFPFPKSFCHCFQISSFVVGIEGVTLKTCPAIYNADVQLGAKLHRFSGFPPHNGPDEGLAYTDDSVGNSVCPVTGGGVLLVVLVPLILLLGCAAFLFGGGSSAAPVSEEVNAYSAIIQLYAREHGISEYTELIKAVMMQESAGRGNDPMQASESAYNTQYGYNYRVEWCACFVSWCAAQCGVLDTQIPKFAYCPYGVNWFADNGRWQDRSYTPSPGDVLFFDWESDGISDHVGIVEKLESGLIHTVEGNINDSVVQKQYALEYGGIYGYGTINNS